MRKLCTVAAVSAALLLAACGPDARKADTGLAVGAVAGGLLGNQFGRGTGRVVATAAGAVIGGIVGSEIGRSMDKQDRILAQQAETRAFEQGRSGERISWRNPDNGRYGEVIPDRPYKRGYEDCRDFSHTIYIDGRPQSMRGTACRNPDGSWRNVS
jgi:surface antigen